MTTSTELRADQEPQTSSHDTHRFAWLWVLVGGAVIWILAAGATAMTDDNILVPTLILVGSFLIPVSMVMFALSRKGEDEVPHDILLLVDASIGTWWVVHNWRRYRSATPTVARSHAAVPAV